MKWVLDVDAPGRWRYLRPALELVGLAVVAYGGYLIGVS